MPNFITSVSWETIISNVQLTWNVIVDPPTHIYTCEVFPINPNDKGSGDLVIGYYLVDYLGNVYEIEGINGWEITVRDINKGVQTTDEYTAPYQDQIGFIYTPKSEDAINLSQSDLIRLYPTARDLINQIDNNSLDFIYEQLLGNPTVDGYVLSSTTLGVRSWIEMTGGGGGGYWTRTGTLITPVTSDDTLGINTIQEETLNNGIDVLSTVRVNTGKTPGLSRFKHGLEINYGQGIATLDNFTVHTNLYTAIVVNSNDNSLLLMNNALGKIGFFNATPSAQSTGWTVTNHSEDKDYDIVDTTVNEIARVLGTVITELKNKGLIGS